MGSILDQTAHDRPGAARIKGDKLALSIDGVDYWADCTSVTISFSLGDAPEIGRMDVGGWRMDVGAVQSTDPGSLWSLLWSLWDESAGRDVDYTYAPHGNLEATTAQPHLVGTLWLPPFNPPPLGGDAGEDTEYSFTTRLYPLGQPRRVP